MKNKPLSIIFIFCLGILVYSNTFFCSFHFDDFRFIVDNPFIKNINNLQNIWQYYHGRFFVFLSIALNYHFNGLHVFGYHLFNLAVHLASAILVWWLTMLTLSTPAMKENKITQHANIISLFAGLVFVSHPVQIEAVTNIWQRAASMVALFYLASLTFYVKSRLLQADRSSSGPKKFYYIASLVMAVVALFTKENAITVPLMILLYEFTFLNTKRHLDWKYISPFLLTIFIVPVTLLFAKSETFQDFHGDLRGHGGATFPAHYFLTQFRVMVTYIRLSLLPINQNFDYDYPVFKSIFEIPVFSSFLFLITIFYWAIRLFSKYRLLSFSVFWFFLTLSPESSFWPMGDVILEHRLYLPLAGYSIFLVSSMYYLFGKNNIKTMLVMLMIVIGFNSVLTFQRNKIWRDDLTLWGDTIRKSPQKARAYDGRGFAYFKQGKLTEALSDFNKAIKINPDYAEAYNNRGIIYSNQGRFIEAMSDFNRAIKINPNDVEAYNNRGFIYGSQGNFAGAIREINKAIKINPHFADAYNNRAVGYYQLKEYDQAWRDVHKVEELGVVVNPQLISGLEEATRRINN